jgi:ribosomal protein L17
VIDNGTSRSAYAQIFKLEQLVVSNLVQELLPFSKIETTSFEPTVAQELLAVSNLAQELLVVSKIETTTFEPTVSQELIVVSKSSGTASSFEN